MPPAAVRAQFGLPETPPSCWNAELELALKLPSAANVSCPLLRIKVGPAAPIDSLTLIQRPGPDPGTTTSPDSAASVLDLSSAKRALFSVTKQSAPSGSTTVFRLVRLNSALRSEVRIQMRASAGESCSM